MKTESKIFLFLIIFFAIVTPIYAYMTWADPLGGGIEPIGTTALALTLLFAAIIWGMLALTGRSVKMRPEDRKDGEIVDGAGVMGFFPPSSLVPFWSAVAASLILLGFAFGWWVSLLGLGVGIWAAFGWAYEFYVGDYKH